MLQAMTHRSHGSTQGSGFDYERLEFLGDAVLDLAVGDLLLESHPKAREGELSKMRATLVSEESLASIARELHLGDFIRFGPQELAAGGSEKSSILADVVEALLGAIYREESYEVARSIVRKIFGSRINEVHPSDPKTELQEILQAKGQPVPQYIVEQVEGPEHSPIYQSAVIVEGEIIGRGRGVSKKSSQQEAAKEAIIALQKRKGVSP